MRVDKAMPRILVIEHDRWLRSDLVAQLAGAGYHVRNASNGFSGLRLAQDAPPDLIVLGDELPDLGAGDVREQLGGDPRTCALPVIDLTIEHRNDSRSLWSELHQALNRQVPA